MFSEQAVADWGFVPVHDFLRSTSLTQRASTQVSFVDHPLADQYDTGSHLGDFGKIWEYLGQPLSVPPPTVRLLANEPTTPKRGDIEIKEALDGFTKGKGVRWRDELAGEDFTNKDGLGERMSILQFKDTEHQRARRRDELNKSKKNNPKLLAGGIENESKNEIRTSELSQARKAIINRILHGKPEKADSDAWNLLSLPGGPQLPVNKAAWPGANLRVLARPTKPPVSQEESTYAVAAERKARLVKKLHERFHDERQYLNNISLIKSAANGDLSTDIGVHVFIDASNIMIGFHNAIKLSRGLSISSRLRRQPLSFHNLSLVLERGRPTAKRVLVGSDNFPAIQEARAIGYETNILDRVHKAKALTPRQKKFIHTTPDGTYYATSGQSSGSETTAATHAPEKWVEQAVDEILHLKILESVVDATEPSTMVLATGDAAEAEYSQGFLKMVERALEKGWKVELVSFKHNTSGMYKRKEFRGRWGEKFKIIELDDFVEELLGVELRL